MEKWDLYRRSNSLGRFVQTGETIERGTRLSDGTYHMVVQVWLQNSDGHFLISQRAENKSDPLKWEPTGGSALAGEKSVTAACREVYEELGIVLDPERGIKLGTGERHFDGCDDFVDVWLFKNIEVQIEEIRLQREEVKTAAWKSAEEIRKLAEEGKWIPWSQFNYLDKLPFEDLSRKHAHGSILRMVKLPPFESFDESWNWFQLPESVIQYIRMWNIRFADLLLKANMSDAPKAEKGGITFAYYGESYYLDSTAFGLLPDMAGMMMLCAQEMEGMLRALHAWNPSVQCVCNGKLMTFSEQEEKVLGQIVHVMVDRPLGSRHPKHSDLVYEVNYGYIYGITGGDGEEQDAYILGVNEPLRDFTGRVRAVIRRLNDNEDKWIVCPDNYFPSGDEIKEQVNFQEKYFQTEIYLASKADQNNKGQLMAEFSFR